MASYYDKNRRLAADIDQWVIQKKRGSWHAFCNAVQLKYGFSDKKTLTMLRQRHPILDIEDDKLVKNR